MRKLGLWGGCAMLLLALALATASAAPPPVDTDDDGGTPAGPSPAARPRDGWNPFLTRMFSVGDSKPAPKPDRKDREKDKDADRKADAPAPRAVTQAETTSRYRALEEAKLRRRQDVCLRLREIARETHDDELERKALQLDGRAWEVYLERTRQLAGGDPDVEPADQRQPTPVRRTGNGDSRNTASVREVKP